MGVFIFLGTVPQGVAAVEPLSGGVDGGRELVCVPVCVRAHAWLAGCVSRQALLLSWAL